MNIKRSIPLNTPFRPPNCPPDQYCILYKDPNFVGDVHALSDEEWNELGKDVDKWPNDPKLSDGAEKPSQTEPAQSAVRWSAWLGARSISEKV